MPQLNNQSLVRLAVEQPFWDRFFTVAPLVLIGSKEEDGSFDLAPKHMAMPLGWNEYYTFVCSPRHRTHVNIARTAEYTVSYPRPGQVVQSSLSASPRCADDSKPGLIALPTFPAAEVDGVLVEDCYLYLECRLHSILDGFGSNSLIIGRVVAAHVREDALRQVDRDEGEQIHDAPLLAYLNPGRFAEVRQSTAFPFPKGFSR